MSDNKLFLLACVFASRADSSSLGRLYDHFQESSEFIDAVIVLWPELDDPLSLKFLFEEPQRNEETDSNLVVSLLAGDQQLIPLIELDDDALYERVKQIRCYIDDELAKLSSYTENKDLHWLQKRILICNNINPVNTRFYQPLWDLVNGQNSSFDNWIDGIVMPLSHLNERSNSLIKISELESIRNDKVRIISLFLNDNDSKNNGDGTISELDLKCELLPFIKYDTEAYNVFLNDFFNGDFFKLDSINNYESFKTIYQELIRYFPTDSQRIEANVLENLFENSDNLIGIVSIEDINNEILETISDGIVLDKYQVSNIDLKMYCTFIRQSTSKYSLRDIYDITKGDKANQTSHFGTLCEQIIRNCNDIHDIEMILQPIKIFNHLENDDETRFNIVMETVIRLEKFNLLEMLLQEDKNNKSISEEERINHGLILENYFWQFFNNASNSTTREMQKAKTILRLLNQFDLRGGNHDRLTSLVEVSDELLSSGNLSIKISKKIPFKPSNILDFSNDPYKLVTLLLELNPSLYKSIDSVVFPLLKKLYTALELRPKDDNFKGEYARLLSLHIDFALVNNDFMFAYEHVNRLFTLGNDDEISQYWSSVLQVGKYNDPTWLDNEIPTEIIVLQMEVLSKLLNICPLEEIEIVSSQWSGLELELTSRDVTNDKYSLENNKVGGLSFKNVSSTVSNLLAGFK